jgi:hypothetical protein
VLPLSLASLLRLPTQSSILSLTCYPKNLLPPSFLTDPMGKLLWLSESQGSPLVATLWGNFCEK